MRCLPLLVRVVGMVSKTARVASIR